MLRKRGIPEIITFLLTSLILLYFYHEVILHPNDYLFSALGDGVKNYYSYIYHAQYDSSFWQFGGMNYPYYEHMVYTDGHPLLSYLIGALGLADYAIGILNLLMMLAYPICAVFIYWILRHFKVANWWSIAAAVAITFLAPQVFRMTGHFSLSYPFAIPGMWLILIKANQSDSWKWMLGGLLYVLAFFFTHPYLGLILAIFGFTFWLVNATIQKGWKMKMIKLLVMVLLPIILFQFIVYLTDTHVDRTGEPQGFYDYHARWISVLVPHHGPMTFLRRMLHLKLAHWETMAYVGFGTITVFLITLGYAIAKRKEIAFKKLMKNELVIFIIAAWLVLVFSFCFPFKFSWMRWFTDLFGPLKQFRVLGRFAWIFFFVSSISAVVVFYRITLRQQKKIYLTVLFFGLMVLQLFEGAGAHEEVAFYLSQSPNSFKYENLEPDLQDMVEYVRESDYDALIILPLQHMSSENIMLLAPEEANFDAFMLSYHANKPMLNSISSRMSISEAIKVNNFLGPEYLEKELIDDFPEDDKILIIKRPAVLKDGAMRLIFSSQEVYKNPTYTAFEFQPEKYNTSFYFDQIVQQDRQADVELEHGFRSDTAETWFYYESWDDDKGEALGGEGALHGQKEKTNVLLELDQSSDIPNGSYTVSFWYYLGVDAPTMMGIIDADYKGDKESAWVDQFEIKESTHVVERWCHVKMTFEWTADIEKLTIFLTGSGNLAPFYVDELMVYANDGHDLFKRLDRDGQEYLIYNNEWLKADSFSE